MTFKMEFLNRRIHDFPTLAPNRSYASCYSAENLVYATCVSYFLAIIA